MVCSGCGAKSAIDAEICPYCGKIVSKKEIEEVKENNSEYVHDEDKFKNVAAVLAIVLGAFGAHCFYLSRKKDGSTRAAILFAAIIFIIGNDKFAFYAMIVIVGLVVMGFVDGVLILLGIKKYDGKGRELK